MKQLIFTLTLVVALVLSGNLSAQTQKGNVLLGGSVADLSLGLNKGGNTTFLLNPKAAWFIQDNLAVGGNIEFGYAHTDKSSSDLINYKLGALGRYYISDPSIEFVKGGKFFLEADLGFQGQNQTKGGATTNGLGFGFGPGYSYFLTPNVGLEALAKYDALAGFGSDAYQSKLTFHIGFQIYMPLKSLKK